MSRYKNPNTNKWVGDDKSGTWSFLDYRCCYLTIRRLENGKFKPMIGAMGDLDLPDAPLPEKGYHELDSLEQAQKFLFKYVDWVRDVWDEKAKQALNARLHRMNPNVFPA